MGKHFGTPGQPKGKKHGAHNMDGGGAIGQGTGSRNKPCKPHYGAQGQKKAGGSAKSQGKASRYAADV